MVQNKHSSTIELKVNDTQINNALNKLGQQFTQLQKTAQKSMTQMGHTAQRTAVGLPSVSPPPSGVPSARNQILPFDPNAVRAQQRAKDAQIVRDAQAFQRARQAPALRKQQQFNDVYTGMTRGRMMMSPLASSIASANASGFIQASMGVGGAGLMNLGNQVGGRFGGALTGIGGALPFVGGMVGSLLQTRMRRVGQARSLELPETQIMAQGMTRAQIRNARRQGSRFGLSPQQTASLLLQFSQQAGMRGTDADVESLAQAQLAGINPSIFGQFAGLGALGGAGMGNPSSLSQVGRSLAGEFRDRGFTGQTVERLLTRIANSSRQMAEQGLSLSTKATGEFALALSDEATRRLRQGDERFRPIAGEGALRAEQRLQTMAGGARKGFAGQFGQIGQNILLAQASKGARSPLELVANLERMQAFGPLEILNTLRGSVSPEMADMALLGAGASTAEIEALRGVQTTPSLKTRGLLGQQESQRLRRRMGISRIQAQADVTMLPKVEGDLKTISVLTKLNTTLETMSLSMTRGDGAVVSALSNVQATFDYALGQNGLLNDLTSLVRDIHDFIKGL